jgi:Ca2+:H+ antiporter
MPASVGEYNGTGSLDVAHVATASTDPSIVRATGSMTEDDNLSFQRGNRAVKLRHRMMAAGAAGVAANAMARERMSKQERMRPSTQEEGRDTYEPLNSARSKGRQSTLPKDPNQGYLAEQFSFLRSMFSGWINALLIFLPIGQICRYSELIFGVECASVIVFSTNFLAIVPLASLLGGATEALSAHTGQLMGGLLNATFGNAVEMIMCIQSVKAGLISVVKGNLLGSILSNLLLVLGMALVASGLKRKAASFNAQGAAANMTCQLVASISVCLPTVFDTVHGNPEDLSDPDDLKSVLKMSRICSVLLMGLYGLFLYFMLKTHSELFADEEEDEEKEDGLSPLFSMVLLIILTVMVERSSDALVDVIEPFSEAYGISKAFIGVILLPIVGNAAEHATAVTAAYNGMIDLALGVAVGSSTQIALFVVPVAVLFGWVYGEKMDLNFTIFDTVCQMLTVFLVSQVLQHGSVNWLHGAMLMSVYCFIAIETLYIEES